MEVVEYIRQIKWSNCFSNPSNLKVFSVDDLFKIVHIAKINPPSNPSNLSLEAIKL